jgi:hypothetical protein
MAKPHSSLDPSHFEPRILRQRFRPHPKTWTPLCHRDRLRSSGG